MELEIGTSAERRGSLNTVVLSRALHREPSLIVWVGVLLGRLSNGFEKSWIFAPWLLTVLADGFNPELPVVTIVEKECHFGADRREGLDDLGSLHTASLTLSHVSEQLVLDGRAEDIPSQFAVKAKSVVKIKAEDPNYLAGQVVEIFALSISKSR